jgi:hypothetical protein
VVSGELHAVSQFIHAYSYRDSSGADGEWGRFAKELTVSDLQGGAFEEAETEEIGAVEQSVEGGDRSVGGASDGGVVGVFEDAELARDERQDFVGEKVREEFAVGLGRGEDGIGVRNVLVAATLAGAVDADDDEGFDFVVGDESGQGLVDLPLVMKAGGAGVEEIFAVHHVEDWILFLRVGGIVVSGWKPNEEGLRIAEGCAGEVPLLQVSDYG